MARAGSARAAGHDARRLPLLRGFAPLARGDARLLVLGSMPGAASLAAREYYAHPRNQFWPIMRHCTGVAADAPYAARVAGLQKAGIAVWDVLHSCQRPGSLDAAIELAGAQPNDLPGFLRAHPVITRVVFNGALAARIWRRHFAAPMARDFPQLECLTLPSTSPANASWSAARKQQAWAAACTLAATAPTNQQVTRA
jgi:hypoxanthine-DNA glycosylase